MTFAIQGFFNSHSITLPYDCDDVTQRVYHSFNSQERHIHRIDHSSYEGHQIPIFQNRLALFDKNVFKYISQGNQDSIWRSEGC